VFDRQRGQVEESAGELLMRSSQISSSRYLQLLCMVFWQYTFIATEVWLRVL